MVHLAYPSGGALQAMAMILASMAPSILRVALSVQGQRALKPALTVKLNDIADHLQRYAEVIRTVAIRGVGIGIAIQCQQNLAAFLDGVARLV